MKTHLPKCMHRMRRRHCMNLISRVLNAPQLSVQMGNAWKPLQMAQLLAKANRHGWCGQRVWDRRGQMHCSCGNLIVFMVVGAQPAPASHVLCIQFAHPLKHHPSLWLVAYFEVPINVKPASLSLQTLLVPPLWRLANNQQCNPRWLPVFTDT